MAYLDEEILEAKRRIERENYTTLETGIYAGVIGHFAQI